MHGPTVGEGERNLFAEVAVKETELLYGRYVVFLIEKQAEDPSLSREGMNAVPTAIEFLSESYIYG